MGNFINKLACLILALLLVLGLIPQTAFAAEDLPPLSGLQVSEDGIVSWDPFEGAVTYFVYATNGMDNYRISETSHNLKAALEEIDAESGDYTVTISAEDMNEKDIAISESPVYHFEGRAHIDAPANIRWEGCWAVWDAVPGASGYVISLKNGTGKTLPADQTRYYFGLDMKYAAQNYYFTLYATSDTLKNSEVVTSETRAGRFAFEPVTNVVVNGGILSWDPFTDTEGHTNVRYYIQSTSSDLDDTYTTDTSLDLAAFLDEQDVSPGDYKFTVSAMYQDTETVSTWILVSGQSSAVTYTYAPSKITTDPVSQYPNEGETAQFTVSVSGEVSSYQWEYRKDNSETWANAQVTGNKTAALKVPATLNRQNYWYRCVVTFKNGTQDISEEAQLVVTPNAISEQPAAVTIAAGLTAEFHVAASGSPVSYQWEYCKSGSTAWANATAAGNKTDTLKVPATTGRNGYSYRCVVTFKNGSTKTSDPALLTVNAGAITAQPQMAVGEAGAKVTFSVETIGTVKSYQWQWRKGYGYAWADSPATGNKTRTLTVAVTAAKNDYQYRCVVTFTDGTVENSDFAILKAGSYTWGTFADGALLYMIDADGLMTISGSGKIPTYAQITYSGSYTVTSPWFEYRSQIKNVLIEDGVTAIGTQAFMGLDEMTAIQIPTSVTYIESSAFRDCSSLADVYYTGAKSQWNAITIKAMPRVYTSSSSSYVPTNYLSLASKHYNSSLPGGESVMSGLFGDAEWRLSNGVLTIFPAGSSAALPDTTPPWRDVRDQVTSLVIESGITAIGEFNFSGMTKLTKVSLPATLTSIGNNAFFGASALTEITIPKAVTSIGDDVFYEADSLKTITVESGNSAYVSANGVLFTAGKKTLVRYPAGRTDTAYTVPAAVTRIGYASFCGAGALQTISMPDGITFIDEFAFEDCGLTSVTLPAKAVLGYECFSGCAALKAVAFGASTAIDSYPLFSDCTSLTTITVAAANPELTAVNGILYNKDMTALLLYPAAKAGNLLRIPEGVKTIRETAFYHASKLTKVELPESLLVIEDGGFVGCSGLTGMVIPKNVTDIGSYAFEDCTSLKEVHFMGNAPAIYNDSFPVAATLYRAASSTGWDADDWSAYTIKTEGNSAVIYMQPKAVSAKAGTTATFRITVTGSVKSYQWQYRTSANGTWTNATAAGNKTRILKVPATTGRNGYQYRCKVTAANGTVKYSNAVTLTVK